MRINRRFLYWGIFLAAIGGVLVAADFGGLDSGTIAEGLRYWPVAVVAIGVGIVIRRTRFSVPGGMLAAALPGLVIGGGLAIVPRIAIDCGTAGTAATAAVHDGVFDGPARVRIVTGCGALDVATAPGNAWHVDDANTVGRMSIVDASGRSLSIDGDRTDGLRPRAIGRGDWHITLPTSPIEDLSIEVNAGKAQVDLHGATVGHLAMTTNAADNTVDLSETTVASLSATVNAGRLTYLLGSTVDIAGAMEVNASEVRICLPTDLGLRIRQTGALSGFSVDGRHQSITDWQSSNYATVAHRADLTVDINLGNLAINPTGGCK